MVLATNNVQVTPGEIDLQVQDSYLRSWFRWCPTSMSLLQTAEARIFSYIKTAYKSMFVNIGPIVGKQDDKIRTVCFNEESEKLPLVLVHGFGAGVGLWCLNLDVFAADRPVYAFDILGFGRSSRPNFSSNALQAESQLVQSIEEWRKQMGLEKFILLGHSMGGFLASAYALQYPTRVSHMILADPWGFPERPEEGTGQIKIPFWAKGIAYLLQPFNPLWMVRAAGPFGPRLVQRVRSDIVNKFVHEIEDADSVIPQYIYHCNAQDPTGEGAFHAMMASFGWAKFPMIHRISALDPGVPMTFIYGARSWIDRHPGQQIQQTRKDGYVDVQIISGAGHHVYADRCDRFNSIVLQVCQTTDNKSNALDN